MKVVRSAQMRELDRLTIEEAKVPGKILMDRAGRGAADEIIAFISQLHPSHVKRFMILAGKGNNGGDAYVVARHLQDNTRLKVKILSTCGLDELKDDARFHAEKIASTIHCEVRSALEPTDFRPGDIIIDGLLGTGVSGPLHDPYKQWIQLVNTLDLPVVSLDLPSGLDGDTGTFATDAIRADLTVTFGLPKRGLAMGRGPELAGAIRFVPIGIPQQYIDQAESELDMIFPPDIKGLFGRLPSDTHKFSRGSLLVIGGSSRYVGAPFLAAKAALRSGAGIVTVAVPESMPVPMLNQLSLITRRIPDGGKGIFTKDSAPALIELVPKADAAVVGPGLTSEDSVIEMLAAVMEKMPPAVFDADALNCISLRPELLKFKSPAVLTPHPGEMKRLLASVGLESLSGFQRMTQARLFSEKADAVLVLKGHQSLICRRGSTLFINSSGGPALATAGTGDVLAGMIGAFLSQKFSPLDAAKAGTFIHGIAGETRDFSSRGLTADDLVNLIPDAMRRLSPFA